MIDSAEYSVAFRQKENNPVINGGVTLSDPDEAQGEMLVVLFCDLLHICFTDLVTTAVPVLKSMTTKTQSMQTRILTLLYKK